MEYLCDWFRELAISNEIIKAQQIDTVFSPAIPTPVVELIFLKCVFFDQPDEVRYLAVELFKRFIRKHFTDLLERVWNNSDGEESNKKKWNTVKRKLHTQTTLRMMSCIQIASKFIFHPKIVRPKEIQMCLKADGKRFTLSMILSSEMRVWETLNFKVNIPTVLTHTELLLEHLELMDDDVHIRVVHFTDFVYLHHQEIYRKLFYLSTGRWEPTSEEIKDYLPTENNVLYRATAVIAASLTFTSNEPNDMIYDQLSNLTNLPAKDIEALSNVLLQIVLS